jgi:hypothetical protein
VCDDTCDDTCDDMFDDEDDDDEADDDVTELVPDAVAAFCVVVSADPSPESPDDVVDADTVLALDAVGVVAGDSRIAIAPPSTTKLATLNAPAARRAVRARGGRRRRFGAWSSTRVCSSMRVKVRTSRTSLARAR